jgi:hypothetical protein
MARSPHRRTIVLIALPSAAVVLALLVASVATSSLLGPKNAASHRVGHHAGTRHVIGRRLDAPAIPEWLSTTLLVLLMIGVIALIWFLKIAVRKRTDRVLYEDDPPPSSGDWDALVVAELGETAVEQLRRLRDGEPRNAIVACWMHFQDTTAQAGLPCHPAETSREYTIRVLRRLALDEQAIATLSELYREARFSTHAMGEPARRRAIDAVEVLATQLAQREVRPVFHLSSRASLDSVAP